MQTDSDVIFYDRRPEWGKDYGLGWIGFNHAASTMSAAIAHVEQWEREKKIVVSHVMIVTGPNECIEAAFPKGIVRSPLDKLYFDNDERYVVFRRPRGLDDRMAGSIVGLAEAHVGDRFDHTKLANLAVQNNFVGWLVNQCCGGQVRDAVDRIIDADDQWICSELAAYCLHQQPELAGRGVLSRSLGALTPQQLFDDDSIFEPLR
ncbi:hypothetical protein [Botrimarina sp.]|uniref:hypothetical protein n=1 Tax=Botrimarina sp. TaxID=2795802 RepID=UPI0032EF2DD1